MDHTIVDEVKEHAGKKKRRAIFEELIVKRLRTDAAVASEDVPSTGGKSPVALKRLKLQSGPQGDGGVQTHQASMGVIMSSSSGPDDEVVPHKVEDIATTSAGGVGVPRDTAEASTSVPDAVSPFDNFYDSQTVNTATADNIYILEWGVTNGFVLHNLSPAAFLDAFNINSTQHTYMVFELRLQYEHEIMMRKKFQKNFIDNCAVVQQRDAEITALKTRLERAKCEVVEVVSLRGRVSKMEAEVAVKSQEVETLGKQNAELLSKVSALESECEELNRHVIKLGGVCERLQKEVVGKAKLKEEFKSFQDTEARCFEQKSTELESHIADVRRDMDNDLYPYMFIVIAERRRILSHSVHLAVMKYAQSDEWVKYEFVSVVTEFENLSFALLDELESLKDSPLASIVTILIYSESGSISGKIFLSEVVLTARAAAERRGLCPPSLGATSSSDPQPPVVQAHDDLFDKSVLDGAGGA
uniref:Transposase (Putative), gypsy type n=1 Tax=Tanacetum cinerariifolium TaxID=118510 RepID=A0A6L2NQ01_TANCI|nr:hypothetical protein [Tanacetum cinerariifolium]